LTGVFSYDRISMFKKKLPVSHLPMKASGMVTFL